MFFFLSTGNWDFVSVNALPAQGHTGNPGSLLHYQPSDFNPCRENFSCEDLGGKIDGSICIDLANLGVGKSRFGRFWAPHQNFMTEKVVIASIFQPSWVFCFCIKTTNSRSVWLNQIARKSVQNSVPLVPLRSRHTLTEPGAELFPLSASSAMMGLHGPLLWFV